MSLIENVPKEYESGFVSLFLLSSTSFNKLINTLKNSDFSPEIGSLAWNVANNSKLKFELLSDIFTSASSLYSLIDKYDLKISDVSKEISGILSENKKIKAKKISFDLMGSRLTKVLENEQLYVAYKSYSIYLDHKNLYIAAKILSDVRPIFSKPEIDPKASIISNTLHIHYRTGETEDDHKDFFVALDANDIQNLKKAILRVEKKNETLKKIIKKSNMTFLDPSEEE